MESKYIIKEAELNENVYDEDGVVVGTAPYIKYVVYDKATDTPITQFDYECDAIEWCNAHDQPEEPTYQEVCEKLKLDFQCSRCGSKVVDRKGHLARDCRGETMINRWKQCFEQARQEIIRSRTPRVIEKDNSAKTKKAINDFIEYCDN